MLGQLQMGGTRRLNRHYQSTGNKKPLWTYTRILTLRGYVPPYADEHVTEVTGNSGVQGNYMPTRPLNKCTYKFTATLNGENGERFTGLENSTYTPHWSPYIRLEVDNAYFENVQNAGASVYAGLQDFRQGGSFVLFNRSGGTMTVNIKSELQTDKWEFEVTSEDAGELKGVLMYMNIFTFTPYNYYSQLRYEVTTTAQLIRR